MTKRILGVVVIVLGLLSIYVPSANAALWSDCGTDKYGRDYCNTITANTANDKAIAYRDSIQNGRSYAISGSCTASTSETYEFTVGASISTEIKAGIFGGVKAELNASASRSVTTGYVTSASFKIPAHDTVRCDRGTIREKFAGTTVIHDSPATFNYSWNAWAPTTARWWIY